MKHVQQDFNNGKWYCQYKGQVFGPFEEEKEAWDKYEELSNIGHCPTCED